MKETKIDKRALIGIGTLILILIILVLIITIVKHQGSSDKSNKKEKATTTEVAETTTEKEKTAEELIEEYVARFDRKAGKDTKAPLILSGATTNVELGASKIPDPGLAIDDYDKEITFTYEGTYDLNKIGTYKVVRIATDDAGNAARQDVTLNVVAKLPEDPEPTRMATLTIEDAIKKYKTSDDISVGIDVSRWQGDINWEKVKASGVSFVIMRLGIQDGVKGEYYVDRNFVTYFKGAQAAGLKVGVYLYTYATCKDDGVKDAIFVYNTLKENDFTPDLPIAFDWESFGSISSFKTSIKDLNDALLVFQGILETAGYQTCLYNSKFYLSNGIWENPDDNNVWLAQYNDKVTYEGKYFMWQCSNTGSVPGISGDVDIDIMYSAPKDKTITADEKK